LVNLCLSLYKRMKPRPMSQINNPKGAAAQASNVGVAIGQPLGGFRANNVAPNVAADAAS
jgi:hypothetical protein